MSEETMFDAFFKFLHGCYERDDRATIANLRCALRKNLKYRAWPLLARYGGVEDEIKEYDHEAVVVQTIAGLYATYPSKFDYDFGISCRMLMKDDEKTADPRDIGPVTRRFQHLISAERDEICSRVIRMVLLMKANNIPVNYYELCCGLLQWSDKIKNRWAGSFWNVPEMEEAS